jgi:segregation and condensation protein A
MEIKTRMLLPSATGEEVEEAEGLAIDPRAELVRQLLEYKAFKDAAGDLAAAREVREQRFGRQPDQRAGDEEDHLDLEDAQIWDLFNAFSRLMAAIGQERPAAEVIYDDTPLELHAEDILDRLRREGAMSFERIFEGRTRRSEVIGLFLALLELIRREQVFAAQERNFKTIYIQPNPNPPSRRPAEESARAAAQPAGEYVPQPPPAPAPPAPEDHAHGDSGQAPRAGP